MPDTHKGHHDMNVSYRGTLYGYQANGSNRQRKPRY